MTLGAVRTRRTQETSIWVFENLLRLVSVFVYLHSLFISEMLSTESQLLQKDISYLDPVLFSSNIDVVLIDFYIFGRLSKNHQNHRGCWRVIKVGITSKFLDGIRVKDFAI